MKRIKTIFLIIICLGILNSLAGQTDQTPQKWDGNRTTPVHLIPLKDEFNQTIVPSEPYPSPYSTRYTCAPCHDYDLIQKGLHFNAVSSIQDGRPGEPWVWIDLKTGTILPLSYRKWKGMWNPQELGISSWDFSLMFGRHMNGGGIAEPKDTEQSKESRWNVSGKIEINCMGCHNASRIQDHSEWAKQVLRQNFRWAATASSGLGEVGGMASRLSGTWDIYDGPNPDDKEWAVAPFVRYHPDLFDSKHRVFFDIAYKPDDSLCLNCHSVSPVEMKKFNADNDVHRAAGMKCVDCHRNDISHAMIRGYEGEAEEIKNQDIYGFTCKGCHLGKDTSGGENLSSGRLGAPYPKHSGIPAIHFDKLSCTVCHSGPLPGKDFTRVRTSRANRLGIYGIAQWYTESPAIIEPAFIRDESGKITPHRLIWPAFWGKLEGEKVSPLKPSDVQAIAGDIFEAEQHVARILAIISLYTEIDGTPVFVSAGNVYELNQDGGLDVTPYSGLKISSEILWAVKKNGEITSLIPYFDPDAEAPEAEIEARIQKILEALALLPEAPGKPVLINKKMMYRVSGGYLEAVEWPGKPTESPQLFWLYDNQIHPLATEFEIRTIVATVGHEQTLTEEQVELVLKSLAQAESQKNSLGKSDYLYVSGGRMFRIDEKGKLKATEHPAAEPVAWPLGHQVRPAQQSLGKKGCRECHKAGSSFFFSPVKGIGPLLTQKVEERSSHSFLRLDKPYQKLFGLSFSVRPVYKAVLFVSAIVIGSVVLLVFFLLLGRLSGLIETRR